MLCYNCMNYCTDSKCEHCGFDSRSYIHNPIALEHDTVLKGNYLIGNVIGNGGFGITYVGYDNRRRKRVAIKEFFPVSIAVRDTKETNNICVTGTMNQVFISGVKKFYQEASILSRLQHIPSIVKVYDFFYENNTAYIVMEYIDGPSIGTIVKNQGPLDIDMVLTIFYPILEALKTVHAEGVLHRDISPSNILLDENYNARLIDFGASRVYSHQQVSTDMTVILKSGFAPAEQYKKREHHTPSEDIYALSASMYYALTGKIPPEAIERLVFDTLKPISALGVDIPEKIERIILKGMAVRVDDRYKTAEEMALAIDNSVGTDLPADFSQGNDKDATPYKIETRSQNKKERKKIIIPWHNDTPYIAIIAVFVVLLSILAVVFLVLLIK